MLLMKNVIIIHGYGADPDSNWFPWLKRELESAGLEVEVPDFGQDVEPGFSNWSSVLSEALEGLDPRETVLVGHSLGGALIPRYLSGYKGEPFLASFLVASPFDNLGWGNLEGFFEKSELSASAKDKIGKITILASDDDPYVPLNHAEKYGELLGGEVIVEKGLEHLWQSEYKRLQDLIKKASSYEPYFE